MGTLFIDANNKDNLEDFNTEYSGVAEPPNPMK